MDKTIFKHTNRKQCPLPLIQKANEGGWLDDLAVFMVMKRFISHGHFKSLREASDLTKIPRSTLHRKIRVLKKQGLVYKQDSRYRLATTKTLRNIAKSSRLCTVFVSETDSPIDVKYSLLNKIKEEYANQQEYHIRLANLVDCSTPKKKHVKAFKKAYGSSSFDEAKENRVRRYNERRYLLDNVGFTYDWLGRNLYTSKSQAYHLTKWSVNRGMCIVNVRSKQLTSFPLMSNNVDEVRRELLKDNTHCFLVNGKFYKHDLTLHKQKKYWDL